MLNLYVVGNNYMDVDLLFDTTRCYISGYLLKKSTIRYVSKNIEIDKIVSINFVSLPRLDKFLPGRKDYIKANSDDIKDIIDFLDYVMDFRKWFDEVGSMIGPISNFEGEVSAYQSEVFVNLYSRESGVAMRSTGFNFNNLIYQHLKDIERLTRSDSILNDIIHYSYAELIIEAEIKKWLEIKNKKLKEGELNMSEAITINKGLGDSLDALRYAVGAINAVYGTAGAKKLRIEDVKFNGPATIVFWSDGTKTIVKCGEDDVLDREKGLAMAICKKVMGNKGNYYNEFKKWLEE